MKKILATLLLPAAVTAAATAALSATPTQASPSGYVVKVSIEGNDSPEGQVTSRKAVCRTDVKVKVFEQVGSRGGGDDVLRASDTTGSDGSWSVGNPGFDDGDLVYAKVRAHHGCKVAFSPTITVDKD